MRKLNFVIAIIIILSAFCCKFNERNRNLSEKTILPSDFIQVILRQTATIEQESNGLVIENQIVFWGNDSLICSTLDQLASEEMLFFYTSQNVCPPCLMITIELLETYFPDYKNNNNIVFISPDWATRLRNDCYGKRLLTLQNGLLGLAIEKEGLPFFFRLSRDLRISSVHLVAKVDFERTRTYLEYYAKLLK
ncbi:MAG: hypothetical protein LBD23_03155 [Oscillospiraceae bacterium]|jgi:hypothetical protein|nr:hypothetical protein [Oscillospiraceae bacterium]